MTWRCLGAAKSGERRFDLLIGREPARVGGVQGRNLRRQAPPASAHNSPCSGSRRRRARSRHPFRLPRHIAAAGDEAGD